MERTEIMTWGLRIVISLMLAYLGYKAYKKRQKKKEKKNKRI
jgi:membrane protein implicated in regulation of membrane protease activity